MSQVTHFLATWALASFPRIQRRDVALVTFAGIGPDLDGFDVIPELLSRHCSQSALIRALQIGRSPLEIFSSAADKQVVAILRQRWSSVEAKAAANRNNMLARDSGSR